MVIQESRHKNSAFQAQYPRPLIYPFVDELHLLTEQLTSFEGLFSRSDDKKWKHVCQLIRDYEEDTTNWPTGKWPEWMEWWDWDLNQPMTDYMRCTTLWSMFLSEPAWKELVDKAAKVRFLLS